MNNWKYVTVVNNETGQSWSTWVESDGEALREAAFLFKHGTGWSVK